MPEYLAPGVYVEETPAAAKPIEGVATSTCAFIGIPARIIIDKHVLPGVTRIGAFGWSTVVVRHRSGEDESQAQLSPGRTEFDAVTFERDLTYDPTFDAWLQQASGGEHLSLRKTVAVELVQPDGRINARWCFRNAWPSKLRIMPINFNGHAAVVQLVTIEHEGVERDALPC
jgi:phage tail-like protein